MNEIATMLNTDQDAVRGLVARARIGLRHYRAAAELPCATAQAALAAETDGRRHDRTVRRHVRGCGACQAYRQALRADARALRALAPTPLGPMAGGGTIVGLATKGALAGGGAVGLGQLGGACAATLGCVGAIVMLAPHPVAHHGRGVSVAGERRAAAAERHHRGTSRLLRAGSRSGAFGAGSRTSSGSVTGASLPESGSGPGRVDRRAAEPTRSSLIFSWRTGRARDAKATRQAGADEPARGGGTRGGGAGDGSSAGTARHGARGTPNAGGDGAGSGGGGSGGAGSGGGGSGGGGSGGSGAGWHGGDESTADAAGGGSGSAAGNGSSAGNGSAAGNGSGASVGAPGPAASTAAAPDSSGSTRGGGQGASGAPGGDSGTSAPRPSNPLDASVSDT